jgi:protoporphyrin/coproporphyrin ferrochelatase
VPETEPSWGLLLVNLGTPASPSTADVRAYLEEFLFDPRVLDMNRLARWLLLKLVILRTRPAKSAEAYRVVWTERGSPLLFHTEDLAAKLAKLLPSARVEVAMRYGEPSLAHGLDRLREAGLDRILVAPLYPHYSSASTGSAAEAVWRLASERWNTPSLTFLPAFYDHPGYIDAFAARGRPVLDELDPEKVVFSFHGLPERHLRKSDESPGQSHCLASASCCDAIVPANRNCYRAQCFATARALAARLELPADRWEVAFQSRLGRDAWIKPYFDLRIQELAQAGVKRVAVFSPAFVADCLETLEEIAVRAAEDFRAHGGEELRLVPSLNSEDVWAEALARMVGETTAWA